MTPGVRVENGFPKPKARAEVCGGVVPKNPWVDPPDLAVSPHPASWPALGRHPAPCCPS
jgi:hypothetical protein